MFTTVCFSDSCQHVTVNLSMVVNVRHCCMEVGDAVGLQHSTDWLRFIYLRR